MSVLGSLGYDTRKILEIVPAVTQESLVDFRRVRAWVAFRV